MFMSLKTYSYMRRMRERAYQMEEERRIDRLAEKIAAKILERQGGVEPTATGLNEGGEVMDWHGIMDRTGQR